MYVNIQAQTHTNEHTQGRGRFDGDTRSLTDSSEDGDWDEEELDDDGESDAIDPGENMISNVFVSAFECVLSISLSLIGMERMGSWMPSIQV